MIKSESERELFFSVQNFVIYATLIWQLRSLAFLADRHIERFVSLIKAKTLGARQISWLNGSIGTSKNVHEKHVILIYIFSEIMQGAK